MPTTWPLVGRYEELAFAASAMDGPGIVITGEAGVGKTSLGIALLDRSRRQGLQTVRVLCTPATADIPLGAFAPLLPPSTNAATPTGSNPPLELLGMLRRSILERADGGRIVLSVDDAHLLDEISAAALLQLVVSEEVTIVATVRTGEVVPPPIRSLWRDAGCTRLELQNLARDDVQALLEELVAGSVSPGSTERLWTLTRGNPLFVREIIAEALEAGTLAEEEGVWKWTGTLVGHAPLQDLVADRLGRLADEDRSIVALVAAGEPLPTAVLARATDDAVLIRLEAQGLLTIEAGHDGSPVVRLGHPLYGEVLRSSDPQTAAAHRRLISLIGDDPPTHLQLRAAVWALESGVSLPADHFLSASIEALIRGDDDLAYRLAEAAERAGGGPAATEARGAALLERDPAAGEEILRGLFQAADPGVRLNAIYRLSGFYRFGRGDIDAALSVLDENTGFEEPWSSFVDAQRATILGYSGCLPETEKIALPLLEHPNALVRVRAIVPAGLALSLNGRAETALGLIDERMADAFAMNDELPLAVGWWAGARILAQMILADYDGLNMMLEMARAQDAEAGPFGAYFALINGRALLARGKANAAASMLYEAVNRSQPGGEDARRWAAALLAEALTLTGDIAAAERAWKSASGDDIDEMASMPDILRAGAWLATMQDRLTDAEQLLRTSLDIAATAGMASAEMETLRDAARLGQPIGPLASRAATLATWMEGPVAAASNAYVQALADGDTASLAAASDLLERADMDLVAAECAMVGGDGRRCQGLLSRCEGATTPLLKASSPSPLTRREREVAGLAAQGLASRDIASRLFISARTVDNHLSRVYAKLDVTSRDELSSALAEIE